MTRRSVRAVVGWWLRRLADRIDHRGAPKAIGWWFTFENERGIVFREDGWGCRLWYLGDDSYELAHAESDRRHLVVDWATGTARYAGGRRPPGDTGHLLS